MMHLASAAESMQDEDVREKWARRRLLRRSRALDSKGKAAMVI